MYAGQTLFAQLMEFVPWTTFARLVGRYGGDHRVRTLTCAEQYRAMAFAQLTCRESLRDIEACLSAQAAKLYHMGFREPVRRSTLADANETRDWRIYAALAQTLIVQARKLYAGEDLGLDLKNTVYALGATFQALSIFRTASCTMFTRSICWYPRLVPFTSWIEGISTLAACTGCIRQGLFS